MEQKFLTPQDVKSAVEQHVIALIETRRRLNLHVENMDAIASHFRIAGDEISARQYEKIGEAVRCARTVLEYRVIQPAKE